MALLKRFKKFFYKKQNVNKKIFFIVAIFILCIVMPVGYFGYKYIRNLCDEISSKSKNATAKTDIYDVVLMWGQSNMTGYAGIHSDIEKKEDEATKKIEKEKLSKYTGIDSEILNNYTKINHVDVEIKNNTAYEYTLRNGLQAIIKNKSYYGENVYYDEKEEKYAYNVSSAYAGCSGNETDPSSVCLKNGYNITTLLQVSYGTNSAPQFAKDYYEKTGHKVVIVMASRGGKTISDFKPKSNIWNAIIYKYKSAIDYLVENNYNIGNKFYIAFQGESNINMKNYDSYSVDFKNIHNALIGLEDKYSMDFGSIVETAYHLSFDELTKSAACKSIRNNEKLTYNEKRTKCHNKIVNGVKSVNAEQEQLINNNEDIILASSFPYNNFLNDSNKNLSADKSDATYSTLHAANNTIHFNSAALSQIGKESAINISNYVNKLHKFKMTLNKKETKTYNINGVNLYETIYIPFEGYGQDGKNNIFTEMIDENFLTKANDKKWLYGQWMTDTDRYFTTNKTPEYNTIVLDEDNAKILISLKKYRDSDVVKATQLGPDGYEFTKQDIYYDVTISIEEYNGKKYIPIYLLSGIPGIKVNLSNDTITISKDANYKLANTGNYHYPGDEPEALWRKEAYKNINKNRKNDVDITIKDKNGNVYKNNTLKIDISMTDNEFKFGTAVGTKSTGYKWKRKNDELNKYEYKTFVNENNYDGLFDDKDEKGNSVKYFNAIGSENGFKWETLFFQGKNFYDGFMLNSNNSNAKEDKTFEGLKDYVDDKKLYFRGHLFFYDYAYANIREKSVEIGKSSYANGVRSPITLQSSKNTPYTEWGLLKHFVADNYGGQIGDSCSDAERAAGICGKMLELYKTHCGEDLTQKCKLDKTNLDKDVKAAKDIFEKMVEKHVRDLIKLFPEVKEWDVANELLLVTYFKHYLYDTNIDGVPYLFLEYDDADNKPSFLKVSSNNNFYWNPHYEEYDTKCRYQTEWSILNEKDEKGRKEINDDYVSFIARIYHAAREASNGKLKLVINDDTRIGTYLPTVNCRVIALIDYLKAINDKLAKYKDYNEKIDALGIQYHVGAQYYAYDDRNGQIKYEKGTVRTASAAVLPAVYSQVLNKILKETGIKEAVYTEYDNNDKSAKNQRPKDVNSASQYLKDSLIEAYSNKNVSEFMFWAFPSDLFFAEERKAYKELVKDWLNYQKTINVTYGKSSTSLYKGTYNVKITYTDAAGTKKTKTLRNVLINDKNTKIDIELDEASVHFNANGGSGGMLDQNFTSGKSIKITKNAFIRNGYTFAGWNANAAGSGTKYTDEQKIILTSGGTLYAQWTLTNYTITYNLDGGTVSKANPLKYTIESADIKLNNPTKVGYTFKGWTGSNGTTAQTSVTIKKDSTENKTYTANWKANTYNVAFNANGGTGTMSNLGMTYGTSKKLTKNTFKKTGYTFAGWNTKPDGSGTKYTDEQDANNLTSTNNITITLYAQWKKVIILGDVDGNNKINYLDYVAVYNHIQRQKNPKLAKKLLTIEQQKTADMNGDKKISYLDYVMIYNKIKSLKK